MDTQRTRNYATVVYPESAPAEWKNILQKLCIPTFISPLHDKDINEDKTLKKPHYHVLIMFEGLKTQKQAKEVFELISGVGVEPIKCVRAYSRYLVHMDSPNKAQYHVNDVISYAGADYMSMINLATDKYSIIGEMIEFCVHNDVVSYSQLLLYSKANRKDWFRTLCDSATLVMVQFLKSRFWEMNNMNNKLPLN